MSGAGVMLIERSQGRVLLLRRSALVPHAGLWNLPGGEVERGETRSRAAVRELREESGIDPAAAGIRWAGVKTCGPWFALVGYVAHPVAVRLDHESNAFGWYSSREIVREPALHPSVVPLLGARIDPLP